MAEKLHVYLPYFVFKPAGNQDRCGVLEIKVTRESLGRYWLSDVFVYPYQPTCSSLPSFYSIGRIQMDGLSQATDASFARLLAKQMVGYFSLQEAYLEKFKTSLNGAIPLAFDATIEKVSDTRLKAKVLVKSLQPAVSPEENQRFATAVFNMRNLDASTGPFVFRLIGLGCDAKVEGLVVNAQLSEVVPESEALNRGRGQPPSATDLDNLLRATHNIVYLFMPGSARECSGTAVAPRSFPPAGSAGSGTDRPR